MSRLDECFRLMGEKPVKGNGRLHDVFLEDFRKEISEIQSPLARRMFILAKASRLMHLRIGEYVALIAAADAMEHPALGVLLESCLAGKLAFAERTKRLIRELLKEEPVAASSSQPGASRSAFKTDPYHPTKTGGTSQIPAPK